VRQTAGRSEATQLSLFLPTQFQVYSVNR
jgi:hypothetical protein